MPKNQWKSWDRMRQRIFENLREVIFWLDDKFPLVGSPLMRVLRFIRFAIWNTALNLNIYSKYKLKGLDLNKVVWISPTRIKYCSRGRFNHWSQGKVIGGDWDQSKGKFEDTNIFQAFKQRFKEGKEWEKTDFYHYILELILNGEIVRRCRNKAQWNERLKNVDRLYYQIKTNGYKLNRELSQQDYRPEAGRDEISVNIGRDGTLLFNGGYHRLCIAKLLDIPEVPIVFSVRHKKWVGFRKKLLVRVQNQGGKLYQSVTHPDLQDIPYQFGDHRFNLIKKNLTVSKGKLLDIGANSGYFCHKFEEEGFDCYAVEVDLREVYFLEKLKKAENKKFKIIPRSIFEFKKNQELKFDVVLALNIFHHFLKRKSTYENLIRLLKRLKAKELFFEAHKPEEEQMKMAYRNYSPDQFVNFLLKHSSLNKARFTGESENGRRLYKLYKNH